MVLTRLFLLIMAVAVSLPTFSAVYPRPLRQGDVVALLAPSGRVAPELVDSAADVIGRFGYEVRIYPTAKGCSGTFSGTPSERLHDLADALSDPSVRAIVCARGGYGAVHLLDSLSRLPLEADPKWIVGYSDISALHAFMASRGIASVHASMAKKLAEGEDVEENKILFHILEGKFPEYRFAPSEFNTLGNASGTLAGGNLAVLQSLIGTPYDVFRPGTILFIEDIGEPIYKVERMLWQLKLAGVFDRIGALLVGRFTDYGHDENHPSMEEMISSLLKDYPHLPVAYDIPVGHVTENIPLVEGARAVLNVTPHEVVLRLSR